MKSYDIAYCIRNLRAREIGSKIDSKIYPFLMHHPLLNRTLGDTVSPYFTLMNQVLNDALKSTQTGKERK